MALLSRLRFVLVVLALAGCSRRALDLPEAPDADLATPDLNSRDLRSSLDDLKSPIGDLKSNILDMHSNAGDLKSNIADMQATDLKVNAVDLNAPELRPPADLRPAPDLAQLSADLACSPGSCGEGQAALCELGQHCCGHTDCTTNACDAFSQLCISDPCKDHIRDGDETDVDCGGGICPRCARNGACRVDSDCALFSGCDAISHTCTLSHCNDHHMDDLETDVDCGGGGCTDCSLGQQCISPFDCDSNDCLNHVCVQFFYCTDGTKDEGESDIDCGAVCQSCALGKSCNSEYDCASNACDLDTHICVTSQCGNSVKDGDETDVDCGGTVCAACALGKHCIASSDCASAACDALSHLCVADHCLDHRRDGDESDVDCGGASCAACVLYQSCMLDGDCGSQHCDPLQHVCVIASCVDGILDGNESAADCGGECAPCGLGIGCRIDEDCASQACDGISFVCVAEQCADNRQEPYESDIDCGSTVYYMTVCTPCAVGKHCTSDWSCASLACNYASLLCQVPRCVDGVKDGSETDIDCGGGGYGDSPPCPSCALGQKCLYETDCASEACDGISRTCVADHCTDHAPDDDETDTDCGGVTCAARCGPGQGCKSNSDCVPGLTCGGNPLLCG